MKELIYKIIDKCTFGRGLKKKVFGSVIYLPTRYWNYFPAGYEKENFEFLIKNTKEGHIIFDIGAHIGLFSVIAAKVSGINGKVYSFEPTPDTYAILKETVRINKLKERVEPVNKAVSNKEGTTVFYSSDLKGDNSNSLIPHREDRIIKGISVSLTTVDAFVSENNIQKVNFIKIDVEGAEYDALLGAAQTFKNFKPLCILAIHPHPIKEKGDTLEAIYDFINNIDYKITLDGQYLSKESFCAVTDLIDLHLIPV